MNVCAVDECNSLVGGEGLCLPHLRGLVAEVVDVEEDEEIFLQVWDDDEDDEDLATE